MSLVLLIVFIPAFFAWLQSTLAVASEPHRLKPSVVFAGLSIALLAIIWPLIMWSFTGSIHVFGPPFVYLLFSVIAPFGLGNLLISSPNFASNRLTSAVAYATFFAVCMLFPLLCGYFFLAPEKMSVATLLGIKPYH
ncbi:hypothetical protein BEN48_08985 [Hymenobacter glacialis]|uniref:Uncharacterized protein n=1 Tax=Hymenobacter glacialis TaxID=1908236 RepID=A0A1G1TCA5_9BACT|nr:hypothetical protein BEN48_08985 [Hymenobacter glacialis]